MQARLPTHEGQDAGGCRLAALLGVLAPGDEDALHEAVGALGGWDGVRGVSVEVLPERAGGGGLQLTTGSPQSAGLRRVCRDLVDRAAVIGRLTVALDADADAVALEADCEVAATMIAAAGARWRVEGRLLEAQSYQMAGQIAAGLVHDFNNAPAPSRATPPWRGR